MINKKDALIGILFVLFLGTSFVAYRSYGAPQELKQQTSPEVTTQNEDGSGSGEVKDAAYHSPYVGQEERRIKALSDADIEGLKQGSGTPFNGMAKPAELNGVPGPRHVLDMVDAGRLDVTDKQLNRIRAIYDKMQEEAIVLGEKLLSVEQEIDEGFKNKAITEGVLQEKIEASADVYADLRYTHLKTHLQMLEVLDERQVQRYNELRGYTDGADPCENVPEGHDRKMWLRHNGC